MFNLLSISFAILLYSRRGDLVKGKLKSTFLLHLGFHLVLRVLLFLSLEERKSSQKIKVIEENVEEEDKINSEGSPNDSDTFRGWFCI